MAIKYGLAVRLPDGQMGYLTALDSEDPKPAVFATKDEAEKELKRRMRDRHYSWAEKVSVEPYVKRKDKEDEGFSEHHSDGVS